MMTAELSMVSTGTVNDIGKMESIFLDPYPVQVGRDLDIYINVSSSKTRMHVMKSLMQLRLDFVAL